MTLSRPYSECTAICNAFRLTHYTKFKKLHENEYKYGKNVPIFRFVKAELLAEIYFDLYLHKKKKKGQSYIFW